MRRCAKAALGTAILFAGLFAADTQTYEISPGDGSRFSLEVYKTGLMSGKKHVFVFGSFDGEVSFDPQRPEEATAHLTVEASSVACTDTWINEGSRKKVELAARD